MGSDSERHQAVLLRTGQWEFRHEGTTWRVEPEEAAHYLNSIQHQLGWSPASPEYGLRIDGTDRPMISARQARDEMERLRASGIRADIIFVMRPVLVGAWDTVEAVTARDKEPVSAPPQRRLVKDVAGPSGPLSGKSGPKVKAAKRSTGPERVPNDPTIEVMLFEDPREQLRYEVQHWYLMTVPLSQRKQYALQRYSFLDSFVQDVEEQRHALSRGQIISAIVDAVSGRGSDVNSREIKPMREGGINNTQGAYLYRSDGAQAMRAKVNQNTPSARRLMWWRLNDGSLELARLANHDDVRMPER